MELPAAPVHQVLLLALALSSSAAAAEPGEVVERRVGVMGTMLTLEVQGPTRALALAASEVAVRALEATEARLSTWRADSELALLNRTPAGESLAITPELARELASALHWSRTTDGAFDPAVGALVRAWGLRDGGRVPSAEELHTAVAPGGSAACLRLASGRATRLDPRLCIEEGGFGKGAGLDAAVHALVGTAASAATLDLGGQVALYRRADADERTIARTPRAYRFEIASPSERSRPVIAITVDHGSISTSGNSEHAIMVAGVRYGHVLDPRSGQPARDFGSLTIWASDGTTADCLSTGLYVLGPERALVFAAEHPGIEVLVIETTSEGDALHARASHGLAGRLEAIDPRLSLSFSTDTAGHVAAQREHASSTPTQIR